MRLDGSVSAVVTGGASGLGAATARRLADHGVRVAVFDRNVDAGAALAAELGGVFAEVDVTSDASVADGFRSAREKHGQERILVCCAGVFVARKTVARAPDGAVRRFPIATFEQSVSVNLVGTFRCILEATEGMLDLPVLEDGERGLVVTVSSITAQDGVEGNAGYAAAKAGVIGMTLPIARDLMDHGVRVNTILPGFFDTPMVAGIGERGTSAQTAAIPFPRRPGEADEFARLVAHLAENRYVNGEAIRIDGGLRMR